jgi:hypothetical protein
MSTATTINRNSVSEGDVITWRTRNGGHEARGTVQWATRDAVHVEIPGRGIYAVEWPRVETIEHAQLCEPICLTCAQPVQKSWGGWGHKRKPDRRHVVHVGEDFAETADAR